MGLDLSASIAPKPSIDSRSHQIPKSSVKMLHILLLFSFLLSSSLAAAKDLCVADFKATQGPAGYQCKVPEEVVVDDFVYSGLNVAGNFSDIVKSAFNTAIVDLLPGLNGLGLPWHDWTYPVVV